MFRDDKVFEIFLTLKVKIKEAQGLTLRFMHVKHQVQLHSLF